MKHLPNKFIYRPTRTRVHIIDIGGELTYCGINKKNLDTRVYSVRFPDHKPGAHICPRCHKENKKRNLEQYMKPVKDILDYN